MELLPVEKSGCYRCHSRRIVEIEPFTGPSTFRPNVTVEEMVRFMDDRRISTALVTTSEGRLLGLLRRTDVQTGEGS
jgi:predicted transcriptional regulator